MRRVVGIALVAIALVAASFGLTSASATGGDDDEWSKVLRLTAQSVVAETIDLGDQGDSVGDMEVFSDDLYRGGKKIGQLDGTCTATRVDQTGLTLACDVTANLPQGQIAHQGSIHFDATSQEPPEFDIAVVGGTGRYAEVDGFAHVQFVSDTTARIVVHLES